MTRTPADAAPARPEPQSAADEDAAASTALRQVVAPLATMAVTWVVRRVMESDYRRRHGTEPPSASDRTSSLRQVIVWAALSAAAVAVVSVVVERATAPRTPLT